MQISLSPPHRVIQLAGVSSKYCVGLYGYGRGIVKAGRRQKRAQRRTNTLLGDERPQRTQAPASGELTHSDKGPRGSGLTREAKEPDADY